MWSGTLIDLSYFVCVQNRLNGYLISVTWHFWGILEEHLSSRIFLTCMGILFCLIFFFFFSIAQEFYFQRKSQMILKMRKTMKMTHQKTTLRMKSLHLREGVDVWKKPKMAVTGESMKKCFNKSDSFSSPLCDIWTSWKFRGSELRKWSMWMCCLLFS